MLILFKPSITFAPFSSYFNVILITPCASSFISSKANTGEQENNDVHDEELITKEENDVVSDDDKSHDKHNKKKNDK